MALLSLSGHVTLANRALATFTAKHPAEIVGRPLSTLADPARAAALDAVIEALPSAGDEGWEGELSFQRADGDLVFGQVALCLQRDATGEPLHLIIQIADISTRRRVEQVRDRMEIDLRLA